MINDFSLKFFKPSMLEWLEIESAMEYGIFEGSEEEMSLICQEV